MNNKEPKNIINIQFYDSPIGELILGSFKNQLCLLDYRYRASRKSIDQRIQKFFNADFVEQQDEVIEETKKQLDLYLQGKITEFNLPIVLAGSDFQKKVWTTLMETPYGETSSYLDIAKKLNHKKAVRAVATANGANAINLIIPCHRIIGSNGSLVGYSGGLDTKKQLLTIEANNKQRVDLFSSSDK